MSTWTAETAVDNLTEKARQVRPAAIDWAKATWPQVIRAGSWIADAIAAIFVAVGWVLGFGVFCLKGMVYGFCSGAGIAQPAERAARRRASKDVSRAEVPGR